MIVYPVPHACKTHPLGLIHLQTFLDELLNVLGNGDAFFELDGDPGHLVNQLILSPALPRGFTVQQLIQHDSDRPDIILDGVDVLLECLGRHVKRAAHIVLLLLEGRTALFQMYCDFFAKPKSAILATPPLIKILANFRSLCRNLFSPISKNPSTISFIIVRTSPSFILRFFLRRELRSPSLQYSVTI